MYYNYTFVYSGIKRTMHGAARDNIGLAIFGEISTLLSPPTCDYDMLMTHIGNLRCSHSKNEGYQQQLLILVAFVNCFNGLIKCLITQRTKTN